MTLVPGTRFGPYEVVEQIGSGGMGVVWRATDTNLKRDVAVKALPESFSSDEDRLARFQREAEILGSLNHVNIATIYGLERDEGQTLIVMELVDGPTLADRIAEGPLPPDEALGIARQIADALEAAHGQQIVHRDLKPANIKLRNDGTVKVLDFGISKPLEPSAISGSPVMTTPAVTETGVILGTAAYMSPEQARGKFVDQRTDIWAFGCLLFEMLTAQPAFGGEDVMLTLARVLDRNTDFSSIPGTVSATVRHTIALCLEKDSAGRIADIRDVRLALDGKFETPRDCNVDVAVAQTGPLWRRALPAVAAIVITVAATMAASLVLNESAPPQVRRFVQVLPTGHRLNNAALPMLAPSPDGLGFAYSANGAMYYRAFDEIEARIVPGTEGEAPVTPVFSPDGQWVLYESGRDGALKRVSIAGGSPIPLVQEVPNSGWRWPEPDVILFGSNTQCEIYQISPAGGDPERLAADPGFSCYEPTLISGHSLLLYERRNSANPSEPEVAVLSLETGESTGLFPGKSAHFFEPGYLVYFDIRLGLVGRRFDPETLEFGGPVVMNDDILMANANAGVQFGLAGNGNLVYMPGARATGGGLLLGVANEEGQVRQFNVPPKNYLFPSISPNGDALAVQAAEGALTQIFVYELDGATEMRQLTFDGNNIHPSWSRDGDWIYYASDRDGASRIYRQRADFSGLAEPVTEPEDNVAHTYPVHAPDGRLAFLERMDESLSSVKIIEPGSDTVETLVPDSRAPQNISFSADGRAMAYGSSNDGFQVLAERYPQDGSLTRLSEPGVGSGWPIWSKSGSSVRFHIGGQNRYGAVDVDTESFAIRNRRTLPLNAVPTGRWHDSMPGSDEMLIVTTFLQDAGTRGENEHLIVVENWLEELKQRVPVN